MKLNHRFTIAANVGLLAARVLAADPFAENVRTTDPISPEEQRKAFHVPPGFEVQLVAAEPDLRKPMNMAFDTQGRLWVTESREYPFPAPLDKPARDSIRIFSDFDATGRARKMQIFAEGLNIPIGLYPFLTKNPDGHETWKCIAWSIPNIWLFEDTDGDGKADRKEILFGPFDHTRDTHGNQASFRRGFDGWLYATHGFNNDSHVKGRDGHQVDLNSGNTYRMRLDGSRLEQHTHGQVNPFGFAWDPFGNLYSSDCHSAPVYQLLAGGYYPSFGKPHDGLGFAPVLMEHAHGSTAIDGIVYYGDDLWPEEFRDNTFIGNVMTSRVNRDRITFNGSSPRATELSDFVTCDDPWFRPVDNQLGPDGAFYIADFYNRIIGHYEVPLQHPGRDRERGRIWRVVYHGADGTAKLRPIALPDALDGLIMELGSPNTTRRLLAMNAIADRFGATATVALEKVVTKPANPLQSVQALWLLHRLGDLSSPQLNAAAQSESPLVRVHAQRIASNLLSQPSRQNGAVEATLEVAERGLRDPDALVQRCAAEALGEYPRIESIRPLLDLRRRVPANDPHLLYVVRKSIRNILANNAVFGGVLSRNDWSKDDLQTLADVATAVNSPLAGSFLIRHIPNLDIVRDALAAALQHAARYAPPGELDSIASIAQGKFAGDDVFQFTLFKSTQDGFQQRGVTLSPAVRGWGGLLCSNILSSSSESGWWNIPKDGAAETANPWAFQERPSIDGVKAKLLSSHPLGEQLTGTLRSKTFLAPKTLSFYLAGHDGYPDKPAQQLNVVRLRDAGTGAVLRAAGPPRNDVAQRISWDLSEFAGKPVYFEATDGDTAGAYAWLAFGRFDPPVIALPKISPGQWSLRQQEAAELVAKLRFDSLKSRLTELAIANSTDSEVRASAARALGTIAPGEAFPILSALIADAALPTPVRIKACEALVELNSNEARDVALKATQTAAKRLQLRFGQILAGNASSAEALLTAFESGQLPSQLLADRSLKQKLLAAAPANAEGRVSRLASNLPSTNEEIQRLIDQRKVSFESGHFIAANGELIFTKNCRVCHQMDGTGNLVGPQLDGVGNRGLERLLEDVLDPNRNVDPAFHTINVVQKDGDVVSGLFRREEGEAFILADSTGKEISIQKKDITERRAANTSLMPENFGEIITGEDFNNLMAFLLEHGPKAAGGK